MKKAIAVFVCGLIIGTGTDSGVPARNQALAQEDAAAPKRDQPKSLDEIRKLPQDINTHYEMTRLVKRVMGMSRTFGRQAKDPFESPGISDPLPALDGAKATVARLREMMKSADDKERTKAKERAEDILTTYFLADMKARVAELDAIKARITEMEAQLEKRLQAQREIIDLQKKVMQSDASGLKFFGPAGAAGGIGGSGAGGFGGAAGVSEKESTGDFVPAKRQGKTSSAR